MLRDRGGFAPSLVSGRDGMADLANWYLTVSDLDV